MNRHRLQLDLSNDSIIFPEPSSLPRSKPHPSPEASLPHTSTEQLGFTPPRVPKVLARPKPEKADVPFSIHSVGAAPFGCLARRYDTQIFAFSMTDIDNQLALDRECRMEEISLSTVEAASQNIEELRQRVPPEYHDYLDVFDRSQANKLPPHRSCDHKIELTSDSIPPQSRAYRMSPFKLQKVKEYLNENLSKGFITPSKAPYSSPVLFALKTNEDLRFCVDYRKLNVMTKRNRYPLPLIEEVIGKIMGCKHLTRLDIIAAFNKLRMHPESEDMTTFITALESYKYKILPFDLTNDPSTFQQYINDILWNFINEFCQAYLNDIFIYSRIKKKHQKHVSLVLERLKQADLQIDIKKCEFDVKEITFLNVIISDESLRMNSQKVKIIVEWSSSTNLKEVQKFIKFVNFYRRFIRDFFKLIKSLVHLTRKDSSFVWSELCI